MHIFRLTLTAGENHDAYAQGLRMDAVCVVDRDDTEAARTLAWERLGELGWAQAEVRETVTVPRESKSPSGNALVTHAFEDAKVRGVSLILFPEPSVAA